MLPVVLDPLKVRVGVAGHGDALARRLAMLDASGVTATLADDVPEPAWVEAKDVLFVAGFDAEISGALARVARAAGVLVNVEDVPELCDFHVPASVRRGDLLLTVSTGGRAPGLARAVRAMLEKIFGAEWSGRAQEIAQLRGRWRGQGLPPNDVSARIEAHAHDRGWLS